MRTFPSFSIATKVQWIVFSAISMALLLACLAFLAYDYYAFRATRTKDIQTLAEVIGSNSTGALTFQDTRSAKEVLEALRFERHVTEAGLYDRKRALFASYLVSGTQSHFVALPQTSTPLTSPTHIRLSLSTKSCSEVNRLAPSTFGMTCRS